MFQSPKSPRSPSFHSVKLQWGTPNGGGGAAAAESRPGSVVNYNDDNCGRQAIDEMIGGAMHCDDCAREMHRMSRWCDQCTMAICDACVLDHHLGHTIVCYQKASREAKAEFDKFQTCASNQIEQLRAKGYTLTQFGNEIVKKIDVNSGKLRKRADEVAEMHKVMKKQLDQLQLLAQTPLNGKTICDRHHATSMSKLLRDKLLKRQGIIEVQVQSAKSAMEEMQETYGGETNTA